MASSVWRGRWQSQERAPSGREPVARRQGGRSGIACPRCRCLGCKRRRGRFRLRGCLSRVSGRLPRAEACDWRGAVVLMRAQAGASPGWRGATASAPYLHKFQRGMHQKMGSWLPRAVGFRLDGQFTPRGYHPPHASAAPRPRYRPWGPEEVRKRPRSGCGRGFGGARAYTCALQLRPKVTSRGKLTIAMIFHAGRPS